MSTSPRTSRFRRITITAVLTLGLSAGLLTLPLTGTATAQESDGQSVESSSASSAASATTMTFRGRGWGHGRGLSQWGAQGYATKFGKSHGEILNHYYSNTRAGSISEAAGVGVDDVNKVRILLKKLEDRPTIVSVDSGTLALTGEQGYQASGMTAVKLTKLTNGTLKAEKASSCTATTWSPVGDTGNTGVTQITISSTESKPLQVCGRTDGVSVWYPGTIRSVVYEQTQHTVNITSIESALRSIVPSESPSSWNIEALKAQAVAARSYALSGDSRWQPYAETCDDIFCQVYNGWFKKAPGGSKTATTAQSTDAAITATLNEVRIFKSGTNAGRIARTEFSSTSGGYTAGGTFPAVPDEGDVISPRHTWTNTHAVTKLEEKYGEGGTLVDIEVVERNGLGAEGGRVEKAKLHFSNGASTIVSGNTVRSLAGMWSDWFTPLCSTTSRYIHAVYELFVKRPATGTEVEAWCSRVKRGERQPLTDQLSVSDEWAGVQIAGLYEKILRRPAEDGGRKFWLSQVENGMRIEEIAAQFYGSDEYYRKAGSSHSGYVDKLYLDLLGRKADDDGRAFWVKILDRGQRTRTGVAREFYASIESRSDRVRTLYQQVLERNPDRAGWNYWAGELTTLGDVKLAAYLAASQEYYERSLIVDGS